MLEQFSKQMQSCHCTTKNDISQDHNCSGSQPVREGKIHSVYQMKTKELVEIAIELQKANAQVVGIGNVSCRTRQKYPKESKWTKSIRSYQRPRRKLPRLAHCLVILMYAQICPSFPIQRSLKRRRKSSRQFSLILLNYETTTQKS